MSSSSDFLFYAATHKESDLFYKVQQWS